MTNAMGDLVPERDAGPARPDGRDAHLDGRRRLRRPARHRARLARRRGALGRRHRPPARPGRHGRAHPGQHRRVRRGPGDPRRSGSPVRGPARGRPPAALRPRAVAARARAQRRRDVRPGHQGRPGGGRGGGRPDRPDQPRVDARRPARGDLHRRGHARASRPRWPGWRPCSPWSRAGSATWWTGPARSACRTRSRLAETFRRRRAAGGPAEQTFAALVGLELRPRRLREAAALWTALYEHRGTAGRDALWDHPDLLPTDDDFADPEAFARAEPDLFPDFPPSDDPTDGPADGPADRSNPPHRVDAIGDRDRRRTRRRSRRRSCGTQRTGPVDHGAGRADASRARVASQPSRRGSSRARSAALPRRCQPDAGATSVTCGDSRRRVCGVTRVQVGRGQPGRRRELRGEPQQPGSGQRGRRRHRAGGQRPQQLRDHQSGQVGSVGGEQRRPARTRPRGRPRALTAGPAPVRAYDAAGLASRPREPAPARPRRRRPPRRPRPGWPVRRAHPRPARAATPTDQVRGDRAG